jgi:HEAT repeat protein
MPQRIFALALTATLLAGCGKQQPITSGGRTASFWVEALQKPDVELRRKAATKLGPLILMHDDALPALLGALRDGDSQVRARAAWCLGVYTGPRAQDVLPALNEVRQKDQDAGVRDAADKALERLSSS